MADRLFSHLASVQKNGSCKLFFHRDRIGAFADEGQAGCDLSLPVGFIEIDHRILDHLLHLFGPVFLFPTRAEKLIPADPREDGEILLGNIGSAVDQSLLPHLSENPAPDLGFPLVLGEFPGRGAEDFYIPRSANFITICLSFSRPEEKNIFTNMSL